MASKKPQLRIGLIGTGFMGKTHTFGFAAAQRVFDLPYELILHAVADQTEALAAKAAGSSRTMLQPCAGSRAETVRMSAAWASRATPASSWHAV